jgi:hypothetical protein
MSRKGNGNNPLGKAITNRKLRRLAEKNKGPNMTRSAVGAAPLEQEQAVYYNPCLIGGKLK